MPAPINTTDDRTPALRGRTKLGPFTPKPTTALPKWVVERVIPLLEKRGNRDAIWRLLTFLALTHWDRPRTRFPIDRLALARIERLGLTEDQVRGAIKALIETSILERNGGGWFDEAAQKNTSALYVFAPWIAAGFTGRRLSALHGQNGKRKHRDPAHWSALRLQRLALAGFRCEVCSRAGILECHHRTYARWGAEALNDVLILCRQCHGVITDDLAKRRS